MKGLQKIIVMLLIVSTVVWLGVLTVDYYHRNKTKRAGYGKSLGYVVYVNPDFQKGKCLIYHGYNISGRAYVGFHSDSYIRCEERYSLKTPINVRYHIADPRYSELTSILKSPTNAKNLPFVDSLIGKFKN